MSPPPPQQSPQATNMMQNFPSISPGSEQVSIGKVLAKDKSNGSIQDMITANTNNEPNSFNRTKYIFLLIIL